MRQKTMIKKDTIAPFTGIKIELVYLPIESLTPYEKNARKHQKADIDVIKKSIEEFGFNDPIGIWSDKNIIIEGHGRLLALKELGWKTVPCIRLDHLTDEQRKAYALAHNRSAELSTWDFDTLDEELAERNKVPYDLAIYHKQNTVPNYKGHLMTDIEYIAIIGEQDPQKGFNKEDYSKVWQGGKDIDNELSYSKPVDLCLKFIKLYSTERVLDLFGGSGSTLIACEESKRTCYMMELNPVFVDVIVKRYLKYVGSTQNCYLNGQPLPEEFTIGILD